MSKDEQLDADCKAAYRLVVRAEGSADASLDSLLGRLVDGIDRLTVERDEARVEADRMRIIRDTTHAKVEDLRSENAKLWRERSEESIKNGHLQTKLIDARCLLEVRSENIVRLERERDEARAEVERLRDALHIAISAPMGVVPDAALEWYEPERYPTPNARMHAGYREAELIAARTAASAALDPAAPPAAGENEAARHLDDWHDDLGPALWWRFPIDELPYVGSPLDLDWPGYHTHWTPITVPDAALAAEWCSCGDRLAAGELECWTCASVDRAAPAMEVES